MVRLPKPTCVDCGGPRSVGSGQRCMKCYRDKVGRWGRMKRSETPLRYPAMATMCATCIFRTDGNRAQIRPQALAEIQDYLIRGTTHRCHEADDHRNKMACRGGRDFQLMIWARMGILPEPTDEALEKMMLEKGMKPYAKP